MSFAAGVDIDSANGTASIITSTSYYSASEKRWAALTVTDGTASAGATLGQDGTITWTPPVDWVPTLLEDLLPTLPNPHPYRGIPMYWVRIVPASGTDSSTTADHIIAMNRSTVYAELPAGVSLLGLVVARQYGGVGCIEALADAGTASLLVNATAAEFR